MIRRHRAAVFAALATLLVIMPACTSSGPKPARVSAADAYVAAIRWFVKTVPVPEPVDPTDTVPTGPRIVYVAPADGSPIDASSQAAVVSGLADMNDEIEVLFADRPDDALDLDLEGEPVRQGGALLLVGKVPDTRPPVEVSIEVYFNATSRDTYEMRITRIGSDDYNVTAVTQLGQN